MNALLGYFLAGTLFDFILTLYYIAVDQRNRGMAAALSIILTLISQLVIVNIIERGGRQKLALIAAYAVGNGVGTLAALVV